MLKNYLKIAIRNMTRQKTYTIINIAGLAIGLACFILIILYVRYEYNYESDHINSDHIFRVNVIQQHPNRFFKISHSMVPLGPTLVEEIPEITDFTRIENVRKTLVTFGDKKFYENKMIFADQGLFNLFTIPVIQGKNASALTEKFSVVLTQSTAEKYFGANNPIGQILHTDDEISLTVTAIIQDFPKNTHINPDFIISFNTLRDLGGERFMNNWVTTRLITYILLPDQQKIVEVEKKVNEVLTAQSSTEVKRALELEQFSRIHLYSEISTYGNIHYIYLFLAIGFLILIIASINFMNLSTARSARRVNEVGIRKVVGAYHWQLMLQFFGESILISFLALIMALLLADNILPIFENLTGQELFLPALTDFNFYGMIVLIALVVGFLSGSYPALYLSAFPPISVLREKQDLGGRNTNLRRILVVLQFSIAIALIISTFIIDNQINFMRTKKLGFQKEQMVIIPVNGSTFRENIEPFKQTLLKNSNIRNVAGSTLLPSKIGMYNNVTWEGAGENESIALIQNKIDYDFLDTYEIEIVQGRNFSPEYSTDILDYTREKTVGAVILNEEAVRRFGWKNPTDKKVIQTYGKQRYYFNVVGVIKDFHFTSLHTKIEPLSLFLLPRSTRNLSIKIEPENTQNTISFIQNTWNTFNPEYPFEYYFLDETFEQSYQSEEKLQTLFSYFSILSVFISCLGLFGLAAFAAERRTKEIGVRKVLGASISNIILLLTKEFSRWILIANIIAWPLAWIYLNTWLDNFAYRTDITWWIFILAGGIALLIALITVSSHAIRAAVTNPVKALRYE